MWCIINCDKLSCRNELLAEIDKRPDRLFCDKEWAENELLRLTEKYGEGFYLFEAVAMGVKSVACDGAVHIEQYQS